MAKVPAPQVGKRARQRAFRPKVTTGCITCRIRHIKCDEGKPDCFKCTNTGRRCDGYSAKADESHVIHVTAPASLYRISTTAFVGTILERRSFQFFQEETIPQVCGFYYSQFWLQAVLQACHHSPAIRHAAIGLGALHERYVSRDVSIPRKCISGEFALEQYTKAIRLLLKPISDKKGQQSLDVALITCVLFTCFEALRGHLGSTLSHIDGGVKILLQAKPEMFASHSVKPTLKSSSKPYVALETLKILFTRLDIQASGLICTRPLKLVHEICPEIFSGSSEVPVEFQSLEEARGSQDYIRSSWLHDYRFTTTGGAEVPSKAVLDLLKAKHTEKIEQWSAAFDKLLQNRAQSNQEPAIKDVQSIHMLQLHQIYMFIHADINHEAAAADETVWDAYFQECDRMVEHASAIVSATPAHLQHKPHFSIDTGIVGPLHFVASRCRHPRIRRAAIALLFSSPRQEGVFDSRIVARVTQRIMEIEETGIVDLEDGKGIPAWKRICDVFPTLDPDGRRATVHFLRKRIDEETPFLGSVEEVLEW